MATATQNKKLLYVGGLAEEVDEKMLHAAFIPFGDIIGKYTFIDTLRLLSVVIHQYADPFVINV